MLVLLFGCQSTTDEAQRFFLKGNVALNEGRNAEAIRLYNEAIEKVPEFKEAYNNKGVAYYREGKYAEAVSSYTYAIFNIDDSYIEARRNRVDANIARGGHQEAMRDLEFLEEIYPDSAFVFFKRGEVFMHQKDYEKAAEAFGKSYELDPLSVDAVVNKAIAFYESDDLSEAKKLLSQATGMDADEPNIYNTRAMIAIDEVDYPRALKEVNKAIELNPANSYYFNNRGYIHLMLEDLESAEPDITRAIQGDPRNAWAYRNRGMLMNMRQNYESASRNFELAIKFDPELENLYHHYAEALWGLGKKAEACDQIKISAEMKEGLAKNKLEQYCN